ncbi:MAG: replication protein RepA, partial [Hyphomicrobium sp.]
MYGAQDIIVGREFEQPVRPPVLADDGPFYQQVLLCQLGLPRKRVKGPLFERRSGSASLMVQGGPWHSGKDWELQPVPYGIIPRLVLMHVCREAVRTRSPIVDVRESPRAFARELGLSEGGAAMERFRRQTIALWCCRMNLGFVVAEGHGQVKVEPFEAFRVRDPERRGLWPREIVLEQKLFEGLLDNGVPLDA